jgi:Carboxypeptidase regulatory-like domain/TonB dependent receptor-like, beta-barrel
MRTCAALALAFALPAAAAGQEFRGAVTGRVNDKSGGVLPGVTVTATNTATNVASTTVTNAEGLFTIPYLTAGTYAVAAELSGFKKSVRGGIDVRIGDRLVVDLTLEVGQLEETVLVTAQSPLLELGSASAGQVIDEKRIAMMPLSDGNPFVLSRLVPGVAFTGDLKFSRPFDNAGTSSITADGSSGGNEFTLDGSPNMTSGRRVAFVPPAGAVQQFKVGTASFDAADGHTAGAVVNVTLKSGTNSFRGESYYYLRRDQLSATDFFVNKSGAAKPELKYNRPGGFLGGPVRSNRTFFFGAVEWLYDTFPEPLPQTVPTQAMRNGDFSALLAQGTIIYDPATATQVGSRVLRQPFPGNIIPANRINPIAAAVLKYFPLPNQASDNQGRNNFFYTNPRDDTFYSVSTRIDHRLTDKQQLFVRYTRNDRRESRNAIFGEVNGIIPTGNFLYRTNDGVTYDQVYTATNNTLLDVRAGWQRFKEPNVRQHEGLFDPSSLGFSSSVVAQFGGARYFPHFDFDQFSDLGDNLSSVTNHSIYSFQPTLTRLFGSHSLRIGYDGRLYQELGSNAGAAAGEYMFRNNAAFTRPQDNSSGTFGQDMATFLLGFPTAGTVDVNAQRLNSTPYHGLFVQDDWKVSDRLTLNLGLRYEYEGATRDSDNRNVRGFDPAAAISIEAAVKAAYAANPIPQIAPSAFSVRGGLQFASDDNPGFWNADTNNIQPRVGFAYRLTDATVVRGGVGVYAVPFIIAGNFQPGFSQTTAIVPSNDLGLTFNATLANPFPSGVIAPAGASRGADTFLGQDLNNASGTRFVPLDFKNAENTRYMISVQRELPNQWLLEGGYTGSHGWNLTTGGGNQAGEIELNAILPQYLSTSRVRDQANVDFLAALVPNPFRGLLPGTAFNAATVARSQLLRPYPQFGNVRTFDDNGTSSYHSAQFKVEKRFTKGYTLLAAYTWSRFREQVFQLNPYDTTYEDRPSAADVPHRVTISGVWELPFGHGRQWAPNANRLIDAFIGGWSVQAIGTLQSGQPIDLQARNVYFGGDPGALKTDYSGDTNSPVFDISGFYFHDAAVQTNGVDDPAKQRADQRIRLANNVRYFPSKLDGLRSPRLNLWDISVIKQLRVNDRVRGQLHAEFLNAFNRAVYANPNTDPTNADFGKVTSQTNLPRDIQLAFKLIF